MTEIGQFTTYIQIVVDVFLCGAIFAAVRKIGSKNTGGTIDRRLVDELERLVEESQRATDKYMEALEEGRKSAEEVVHLLMEKERRGRELLERINKTLADAAALPPSVCRSVEQMAAEGMDVKDITRTTGLNEGEVKLMVNLFQQRNGK